MNVGQSPFAPKNIGSSTPWSRRSSTPGPLGLNDQSDPQACTERSRTPGLLGVNDGTLRTSFARPFSTETLTFLANATPLDVLKVCTPPLACQASFPNFTEDDFDVSESFQSVIIFDVDVLKKLAQEVVSDEKAPENTKKLFDAILTAKDIKAIIPVFKNLGFLGVAKESIVGGKSYFSLSGYAGKRGVNWLTDILRGSLKGTRYLDSTFKSMNMHVSNLDLIKSAKSGGRFMIGVAAGVNLLQYIMDEKVTLADFGVQTLTDTVKIYLAQMAAVGVLTAIGTVGVIPLGAAVVVGFAVGALLDWADKEFGVTEKLKLWANERQAELKNIGIALSKATDEALQDIANVGYQIVENATDYIQDQTDAMLNEIEREIRYRLGIPRMGSW